MKVQTQIGFVRGRSVRHVMLFLLVTFVAFGMGWGVNSQIRPLTPGEQGWKTQHMECTTAVQPNALGLSRMREARGPLMELPANAKPATYRALLPPAVDNSTLPSFPPIRDQGTINSCVAFSNTYYVMTHMVGMARGWNTKDDADNTNKFSPAWTFNMMNNGLNEGGPDLTIFRILLNAGCPAWNEAPYIGNREEPLNYRAWSMDPTVWRHALDNRIDRIGYVPNTDTDEGLLMIKLLLNNGYVLNVGTHMQHWRYITVSDDPATTADDPYVGKDVAYGTTNNVEGHSMTLVGYNDDIWSDINDNGQVDAGEKGALRIANSAGPNWAPDKSSDGGFVWLAYDALRQQSAVAGAPGNLNHYPAFYANEAYWMVAKTGYTPKLLAKVTLRHAKRSQLGISLGVSDLTTTTPPAQWEPGVVNFQGGPLAFDGTFTECDGTFIFDFTDLLLAYGANAKRWYVGVTDNTAEASAQIMAFSLIDVDHGNREIAAAGLPLTVDNTTAYIPIDYADAITSQPDMKIRPDGMPEWIGDNLYDDGATQSLSRRVEIGESAVYRVTVQNDGNMPDGILVTGTAGHDGWTITYREDDVNGTDITAQVTGEGLRVNNLQAGGEKTLRFEVTRGAEPGTMPTVDIHVTGVSQRDPAKSDSVRVTMSSTPPLTAVGLAVSQISPQATGTPMTITATPTGGRSVEYRFFVGTGAAWSPLRAYAQDPSCQWTPTVPGQYTLLVWAREVGHTTTKDAHATLPFTVYAPLSRVTLSAVPATQTIGNPMTLTAAPQGGNKVEYRFFVWNGAAWVQLRAYQQNPSCAWTPTTPGKYDLLVWARECGHTTTKDVYATTPVTVNPPLSAVKVTSSVQFPHAAGKPVTFTSVPTGGSRVEYRYFLWNNETWSQLRAYSDDPACMWTPTAQGDYSLLVWAREMGHNTTKDVYTALDFSISPPTISSVRLTATPSTPGTVDVPVSLAAIPDNGLNVEYRFFVSSGEGWVQMRGYAPDPQCSWTPTQPGTYTFLVWARNIGHNTTKDCHSTLVYTVQ